MALERNIIDVRGAKNKQESMMVLKKVLHILSGGVCAMKTAHEMCE